MTVIPVTSTPITPSRTTRKRFQRMSPMLRRGRPSFASPREFSSATSPTPSNVIVMRVHLRHLTSQEWPDGPRSTEEVKSLHMINDELRPHPTSRLAGDAAIPNARMTLHARSTATTPGSRAPRGIRAPTLPPADRDTRAHPGPHHAGQQRGRNRARPPVLDPARPTRRPDRLRRKRCTREERACWSIATLIIPGYGAPFEPDTNTPQQPALSRFRVWQPTTNFAPCGVSPAPPTREDVPSSVELRWRPDGFQAALTISSLRVAPTVSVTLCRVSRRDRRCRWPLTRRNCLPASTMPAAHQRSAICPSRQCLTFAL